MHPQLDEFYKRNPKALPLESEFEDNLIEVATSLGYLAHATRKGWSKKGVRTPVKGHPGFPDVVIAGLGRLWIVELKRRPNTAEPMQVAWLNTLKAAGVDARLAYVPEDYHALINELHAHHETHRRDPI